MNSEIMDEICEFYHETLDVSCAEIIFGNVSCLNNGVDPLSYCRDWKIPASHGKEFSWAHYFSSWEESVAVHCYFITLFLASLANGAFMTSLNRCRKKTWSWSELHHFFGWGTALYGVGSVLILIQNRTGWGNSILSRLGRTERRTGMRYSFMETTPNPDEEREREEGEEMSLLTRTGRETEVTGFVQENDRGFRKMVSVPLTSSGARRISK